MHYLDRFIFLFADLFFGWIVLLYCVVDIAVAPLVAKWILPRLLCGKNTIFMRRILQQTAAKQKEAAISSFSCMTYWQSRFKGKCSSKRLCACLSRQGVVKNATLWLFKDSGWIGKSFLLLLARRHIYKLWAFAKRSCLPFRQQLLLPGINADFWPN